MTTPTRDEAVRQQFEAVARKYGMDLVPHPDRDGWRYANKDTDLFRAGYQAALRSPAVAGLVEAAKVAADGFESVGMDFSATALRAALAQYATLAGESQHGL
jgi:hypothetical protein